MFLAICSQIRDRSDVTGGCTRRIVETPAGLPGPRVTEVGDLPLWAGRWVTDAGDRVRAASFPIRKGAPMPYLDVCSAGDAFYLHYRL